MKHKSLIGLLLLIVSIQLSFSNIVYAADAPSIDELEPNDYEKKEKKTNRSLLRDEGLSTTKRSELPEQIKQLTFEGAADSDEEKIASLFLSQTSNRNTIKSKAVEMNLFSSTTETKMNELEEDTTSSSNLSMSILIWVLVGICLLLLAIVLYIWATSSAKKKAS
ncbi:type VII secretion protein EssA [Metabacillus niabensis]|uniref:Type VII secretion protein EssA n=1 Tax=Metabacillus niabensis TaxID=324854 RepID=A0ABT9Z5R4_9BACI|nr:type VII secretion protein EssA [Metabacillus niabensis]MDQ0226625.1 type VII secretion protein EssA [Metabacillus niabensis]PAD69028.1 type VII secretion protein EssA [Bacillus sp. 7586-K]